MSKAQQARKPPSKETIRKMLTRRIPSSLEKRFQEIVNKHNLPYKFVGNGSFIIEHYNPDFINTNSEKIAIEVYADYYKKKKYQNIEEWKKQRAKVFKQYGWEVIFFNEIQVNEDYILEKLTNGKTLCARCHNLIKDKIC